MHQPTVIIICGSTAVGKTSFAIRLARYFDTHIISADSRQCFTELNIGVAKPTPEELQSVKHYFINSHSIFREVNAGVFEEYALHAANEIFSDHPVAVMVGGTGLYIKAFCQGMDDMPTVDPIIRQRVINDYKAGGLEYLQNEVALRDPAFWETAERHNPQRLMRALEVALSSGKSVTEFRLGKKAQRPFNIVKIGLQLPREQLYERINKRVDMMMQDGLADEVFHLRPHRTINALRTVGYKELFDHFDGHISMEQAVTDIKTNTRRYARRQMTWFKKDSDINWYSAGDDNLIAAVAGNIPPC